VDRTNCSDFAKATRAPNPADGIILISCEALCGGFSRTIGVDTSDGPTSLMPAAPQNERTCGNSGDSNIGLLKRASKDAGRSLTSANTVCKYESRRKLRCGSGMERAMWVENESVIVRQAHHNSRRCIVRNRHSHERFHLDTFEGRPQYCRDRDRVTKRICRYWRQRTMDSTDRC
jgi:hypothetical protein